MVYLSFELNETANVSIPLQQHKPFGKEWKKKKPTLTIRNFAFVSHCSKLAWIPYQMWHDLKSLFKESMLITTVDLVRLQQTLCTDRKANGNDWLQCASFRFSNRYHFIKSYYRNLPYKNVDANPCNMHRSTVSSFHLMFCHSLFCPFFDAVIDTGLFITRLQAFNPILHTRIDMKIDYNNNK